MMGYIVLATMLAVVSVAFVHRVQALQRERDKWRSDYHHMRDTAERYRRQLAIKNKVKVKIVTEGVVGHHTQYADDAVASLIESDLVPTYGNLWDVVRRWDVGEGRDGS